MDEIKLILGDCLEEMKKIPDKSVDLVLTDPPYGTTNCEWDIVCNFEKLWTELKRVCKGSSIMTASQPFTTDLINSNRDDFKYCWVWNKCLAGNGILAKIQPLKIHEDICVFGKGKYFPQKTKGIERIKGGIEDKHGTFSMAKSNRVFNDDYYPQSIIRFSGAEIRNTRKHPTEKPIKLFSYLLLTYSDKSDIVLDPFMGSGTTGVACKELGRKFIGIEINEKYFEIAQRRINNATKELFV